MIHEHLLNTFKISCLKIYTGLSLHSSSHVSHVLAHIYLTFGRGQYSATRLASSIGSFVSHEQPTSSASSFSNMCVAESTHDEGIGMADPLDNRVIPRSSKSNIFGIGRFMFLLLHYFQISWLAGAGIFDNERTRRYTLLSFDSWIKELGLGCALFRLGLCYHFSLSMAVGMKNKFYHLFRLVKMSRAKHTLRSGTPWGLRSYSSIVSPFIFFSSSLKLPPASHQSAISHQPFRISNYLEHQHQTATTLSED